MEILEKRLFRGPNYWYIDRKTLIVATIRMDVRERNLSEKEVRKVAAGLNRLDPPLQQRHVYQRILDLLVQIAVEVQCRAGMDCRHAVIEPTSRPDVFHLIFSYTYELAGLYAAEVAVGLCNALITGDDYDLKSDMDYLTQIAERFRLPKPVQQMVDEAGRLNMPVCRLDAETLLFGQGAKQHLVKADAPAFPANVMPGRIPIVTLSGDRNITNIGRLIAQMASNQGFRVGYATSRGVYIKNRLVSLGDRSGPVSAKLVLQHPEVDFAVLESNEREILRAGLAFDQCNISMITSMESGETEKHAKDPLINDIHLKLVGPKCTHPEGYTVLNADDNEVYHLKYELECKIALYSSNINNPHIQKHIEEGGLVAAVEKGYFTVIEKGVRVLRVEIDPITVGLDGKTAQMVQNLLPALLAAHLCKLAFTDISQLSTLLELH